MARRALLAVRELRIPAEQGQHFGEVTVSLGLASSEVDAVPEALQLLELADRRLYLAKEAGRDRCVDPSAGWRAHLVRAKFDTEQTVMPSSSPVTIRKNKVSSSEPWS